jgi:ribose 5-phosphate isomerase A
VTKSDLDDLKRSAAARAVELVASGMAVGLGTGSTAAHATRLLGERLADGRLRDVVGVPTSEGTARIARERGVPLTTLEECPTLDLTIDGADEVDPALDLIKGLGGALLREKIVAKASRGVVIVVDSAKQVARLGERAPVPVEVVRFGWSRARAHLETLGARVVPRTLANRELFVTDEGHYVLDCFFGPIQDPVSLAGAIRSWTGVVEHGLFLGIATKVIVASAGGVKEIAR